LDATQESLHVHRLQWLLQNWYLALIVLTTIDEILQGLLRRLDLILLWVRQGLLGRLDKLFGHHYVFGNE